MATKAVLLCILLVSLVIPHQANARKLPHYSRNAEEKSGKFMASHGVSKVHPLGFPALGPPIGSPGNPYTRPCTYKGVCRRLPPPPPPPRSPYTRPCKYKNGCRRSPPP